MGMQMKTQYRYPIILLALLVALLGLNLESFAVTDIYIDGGSGTNHYSTFKAAVSRACEVGGDVTIHLRMNTVEDQSCTISTTAPKVVNIKLIADDGTRRSIQYPEKTSYNYARLIGMANGTLTIGGNNAEGNTGVVIIRGLRTDGHEFYSPYSDNTWVLFYVSGNATLNILNNTEIAYGKNNIWLDSPNATVNMGLDSSRDFGVIHSAELMNVNITEGTFNMNSGYIVGHCDGFSHGRQPYTYPLVSGGNSILKRSDFISAHYTGSGYTYGTVSSTLRDYYPDNTINYNGKTYNNKINKAIGVYVHCSKNASGERTAKFNMNGGMICGLYLPGTTGKSTIVGRNSGYTGYVYFTDFQYGGESTSDKCRNSAIVVYGGYAKISDGDVFSNNSGHCGGGIIVTGHDFDVSSTNENYEHAYFEMTGGRISYCQADYGGAARGEYGALLEMSGGDWSHNVASDGGGALRLVTSKFIMSGTSNISYNINHRNNYSRSGGGIAATWNASFGHIDTWVELNGGTIHHNVCNYYGGGVSTDDSGEDAANGSVKLILNGCEIYNNQSQLGGGVAIGGKSNVTVEGSTIIRDNTATSSGGGIYVYTTSNVSS